MVAIAIIGAKVLFVTVLVLQVVGLGVFFERKVSALIQNRIGANRAAILFAERKIAEGRKRKTAKAR